MANFPTSLPSITNPNSSDTLAGNPHHEQHAHANDNVAAVAAKIGTGSSTPTANQLLIGSGTGTSAWGTAIGSGDNLDLYAISGNDSGSMLTISRGTTASPDTTAKAVVKINRYHDVPDAAFGVDGTDGGEELAALVVVSETPTTGTNQPIAVLGVAHSKGTDTAGGTGSRNPDATGGYFRGWVTGSSATGNAIGSFSQGHSESVDGRADGMQVVVGHSTGGSHSIESTGKSESCGIWLVPEGKRVSVGVQIGNGIGQQVDVGFHVNGQSSASPTATVQTASVANPTVITTTAAHGLEDGDQIVITGSNSTPTIDGTHTATVTGTTTFTIPVNVTVQGTAGSITGRIGAALTAAFRDDSYAKNGVQIRGSHSSAAVNLSEAVGGMSIWLPQFSSTDNRGDIRATNIAGNGTRSLFYYNSSGVLVLGSGAEANIYSGALHIFGAGINVSATNIATDTTTGTKIGTSASQKLGFFNATPVVQPSGVAVSAAGIHAALVTLGLITA